MHKNNSSAMKRWIAGLSATFVMALSGLVTESSYSQEKLEGRFICKSSVGEMPTTVFQSSRGTDVSIIKWSSKYFSGSGFTPERRCQVISLRLQKLSQSGNLEYFISTKVNDSPVICASRQRNGDCDNLIFTLIEDEDYSSVLNDFTTIINELKRGNIAQPHIEKSPPTFFVCASRSASGNCSGLLIMQ